jgi:hypothetical protein
MQDEVYNRALFRRRAESAREKLREMGGVGGQGPQGIMASSPELMAAAAPRAMAPQMTGPMPNMMAPQMRPAAAPMQGAALPNIVPGMFPQPQQPQPQPQQQPPQAPYQTRQPAPQPQPMQPGQPKQQQPQPIRLNQGGDIALEARRQGMPDPSLGAQIAANPAFAGVRAVDITEAPTPRGRSTEGDVLAEVRAILGENPEAQSRVDQLETTLSNPEATSEERQRAITTAAGVENDKEGLRSVVTDLTGEEPPANATVDELNRAIMGVSIGGAIGGPGSVAERISNAILQGLEVQRETAAGREDFQQRLAVAQAGARTRAAGGVESRDFRNPIDAYQAGVEAASRVSEYEIPEGMTRAQFENEAGLRMVRNSYTPEQLVGTRFEGMSAGTAGAAPAAPTPITTQAQFDALPSGARYVDAETGVIGVKP